MPRILTSTNYLLSPRYHVVDSLTNHLDQHYRIPSSLITNINDDEVSSTLSPNDIDRILSRKLYEQLNATSSDEQSSHQIVDHELTMLIDRFFNLTYQNTIPMVNLLATAIATNFLQENIRELDKKLQEQQKTYLPINIKRGSSLLYEFENNHDDDDISWASAPT